MAAVYFLDVYSVYSLSRGCVAATALSTNLSTGRIVMYKYMSCSTKGQYVCGVTRWF